MCNNKVLEANNVGLIKSYDEILRWKYVKYKKCNEEGRNF
jgi:hypothetical protein